MGKLSTFQLILGGVFVAFIIIGFLYFTSAGKKNANAPKGQYSGTVTIWSIIPRELIQAPIAKFQADNEAVRITYRQINESEITAEVINALAQGTGPDILMFPAERLIQLRGILYPISYANISQDVFMQKFIDGASVLMQPEGIYGLPVLVDPMVMYVNRDILNSTFIANAPQYWDEFPNLVPNVTQKNNAGLITRSTVALGFPLNISHVADIMTALFMQLGSTMVATDDFGETGGGIQYRLALRGPGKFSARPIADAFEYAVAFSDPAKTTYTWSAGLPLSRDYFVGDRLLAYFGYASEYGILRSLNPNLNFSIEMLPQMRVSSTKATFGKIYALGMTKKSQNVAASFALMNAIVQPDVMQPVYTSMGLPPVFKSSLAAMPNDHRSTVTRQSALITKSWLNPLVEAYDTTVIQSLQRVLSGELSPAQVANEMDTALAPLFDSVNEQNAKNASAAAAAKQ